MKTDYEFEYTSTCSCRDYDINTEETTESSECYGDCWQQTLEDFFNITSGLFEKNDTLWWKVSNLKLWNGNHSGYGYAKDAESLLELITVRSDWNIKGKVFNNHIEYSLSHHDAPTGSNTTLSIITEEEKEKWGLY